MRISLIALVTVTYCGCVTLSNSYKHLSKAEKARVFPYDAQKAKDTGFALYEIDAARIKADMENDKYYAVLIWVPHCKGPHCKTLAYYNTFNKQLDSLGVRTYLVATIFEMDETRKQYEKFGYSDRLYVMDKDTYKDEFSSYSKPFIEDLVGHKVSNKDTLSWASFMVFKNQQLLGYGQTRERIFDLIK